MLKISSKEAQKKIEEALKDKSAKVEAVLDQAIKDLAHSAYATIQAKAQKELSSTRQDYLKGLSFEKLGDNSYMISLEGDWAAALEDGFASFDITEKMLASSKKVGVGARSGEPWVQTNKQGKKFAHVPLSPERPKGSSLSESLKGVTAMNYRGIQQEITRIFKDDKGNVLQGKVAYADEEGITKYQKSYQDKKGKMRTQSVYIAYRTVSENGKRWMHPGYKGLKAFEDAERQLLKNLDQIIKQAL